MRRPPMPRDTRGAVRWQPNHFFLIDLISHRAEPKICWRQNQREANSCVRFISLAGKNARLARAFWEPRRRRRRRTLTARASQVSPAAPPSIDPRRSVLGPYPSARRAPRRHDRYPPSPKGFIIRLNEIFPHVASSRSGRTHPHRAQRRWSSAIRGTPAWRARSPRGTDASASSPTAAAACAAAASDTPPRANATPMSVRRMVGRARGAAVRGLMACHDVRFMQAP